MEFDRYQIPELSESGPAFGPPGWYAVVVLGQLFGVLPLRADAMRLAEQLRASEIEVSVRRISGTYRPTEMPTVAQRTH